MISRAIDGLVDLFISHEVYVSRLNAEFQFFEGGQRVMNRADHLSFITDMLHARSAALISFIAMATAVLLFAVTATAVPGTGFGEVVNHVSLFVFLFLALVSLRLIRPFGLDKDFGGRDEAFDALLTETARKFAAFQFCLTATQIATLGAIGAFAGFGVATNWPSGAAV